MDLEKYPVVIGKTSMIFEFVSEGIRGKIPKMVIYSKMHLPNVYNLGFGDKDEETGEIDDEAITNNGDSEKVLATVASTLFTFTNNFPGAFVFATGSTKARTRLYRIGISHHLQEIQEDFAVFGFIDGSWHPFEKQQEFDAFLVTRKK